jgi:hypothetical protein
MGGAGGSDDHHSQGVTLNSIVEVMKVLELCPQLVSKSEL